LLPPYKLLKRAESGTLPIKVAAKLVRAPAAVELEIMAPILLQNLSELNMDTDFVRSHAGKNATVHLFIPGKRTKNGEDIELEQFLLSLVCKLPADGLVNAAGDRVRRTGGESIGACHRPAAPRTRASIVSDAQRGDLQKATKTRILKGIAEFRPWLPWIAVAAQATPRSLFRPRHTDKIFRSGPHKDWSNGVQGSPKGTKPLNLRPKAQ
jgi:hypothetical protein